MNEIREYQIRKYSNTILKGAKWILIVVFISQLMQFFSIKLFDISNDVLFEPSKWTFNLQYAIRHIILGTGLPTIIYLCIRYLNKKYQKYSHWFAIGFIMYIANHYSFTHWGFNFLSTFNIFPVLLCCPYEGKVKKTVVITSVISSFLYCIYQIASSYSIYHIFIFTINCSEIVVAYIICESISNVFRELIAANNILNKDAYIDKLTGIFNRNAFIHQKLKLNGKSIAFLDIDDFKNINDSYGHDLGDNILKVTADNLKNIENSTIFRFGGDEFVIISYNDDKILAENLQTTLYNINKICTDNYSIPVTLSVGITKFINSIPIDDLIRKSDSLLYEAKKLGKNAIFMSRDN